MPLYHYACEACGEKVRRVLQPQQAKEPQVCPACGQPLRRAPKPPTSQVTETLDNGFMARRVERPAEAERLYRERAHQDPLKED